MSHLFKEAFILEDPALLTDPVLLKASDFLVEDEPLLTFMLNNIRNAIVNRANAIASQYGLTLRQFLVVSYIDRHSDEIITQKTLEDHMHLSNPTITVLIQNMMKKGLIQRVRVPEDGRKYQLLLTAKAKETCDNCCTALVLDDERIYQGITDEEKQILLSVFRKIEANLGYSSTSD